MLSNDTNPDGDRRDDARGAENAQRKKPNEELVFLAVIATVIGYESKLCPEYLDMRR